MSNMYNGIDPGDMPTMPFHIPGATPGDPSGTGFGSGPGKSGGKRTWSRGKRVAALLGVCAVVGGGTFAVVQATGSPAASPAADTQALSTSAGTQAGTSASATTQAAVLRQVLTGTGIRRLARLRQLGGIYGQYTFETKSGARTLAFERGTIVSIAGTDVEVRATDGTTWTWLLTGTSVVRENGTKEPESDLANGQLVFVGGQVAAGARDARLIVIRTSTPKTPKTSSQSAT